MARFWSWLGRAADSISVWQVVGPLGLVGAMSWAAAEFQAIAQHGWGAVVIAGVGIGCVVLLALTGSLALYRVFRPLPPAAIPATPVSIALAALPKSASTTTAIGLTADQIQCRVALKQFALTWPAAVYDAVTRVRVVLINKIKQNGDRDYSYVLFQAVHFAWSSGSKSLDRVRELAGVELERIDVEALQHALHVYFDDYVWEQRLIANLNALVKVGLSQMPETQKWLETDRNCWAELSKQTIWPEPKKLKKISEDKMASNSANWMAPYRVNF
jgi:hypothetical protein